MAAVQLGMKSGYSLLDDHELFGRMADRISHKNPEIDRVLAGRILDQAVLFVAAAGRYPHLGLSPSPAVDLGWDTFILHTQPYFDFCARIAGRYVHHTPNDRPGEVRLASGDRPRTPAETADVLRECGYWVLEDLWPAEASSGPCYNGTHQGDSDEGKPPPR